MVVPGVVFEEVVDNGRVASGGIEGRPTGAYMVSKKGESSLSTPPTIDRISLIGCPPLGTKVPAAVG